MRATSSPTNSSYRERATKSRDPAMQLWPLEEKTPYMTPARACSRSASSKTIVGDLPPSSSDTGISLSAAACARVRPVFVPPVKVIFPTAGCRTIASPMTLPRPGSTESSAVGSAASVSAWWTRRPRARATSGVHSAGLRTTALPAASAGASFWASLAMGEFHGVIAPTTPMGSWTFIVT